MDIPALSMALSQTKALSDIGMAVLDKSLDTAQVQGAEMAEMIDTAAMELSVNPHIGGNFDMKI